MVEGVREGIKEQGMWLKEEMEGVRKDLKEQVRWRKERERMKDCIKGLEKRVQELEMRERGEGRRKV